jgi:hypothetical protein
MPDDHPAKTTLAQKAEHETKELLIVSGYLFVCYLAIMLFKNALLREAGLAALPLSIAAIKALILGKFILIGYVLPIGKRFGNRPLIWPTLNNAVAFLVLLCVLTVIEEVVVGYFHGRPPAAALTELGGIHLQETLAKIFIMFLVLIPFFAFRVLDDVVGEGKMARLFFVERGSLTYRPGGQPPAA